MSAPLIASAAQIIEGARKTYRTIPDDDKYAQAVVVRLAGSLLDLEGEDYEDLVLHLVTAEEIDEDAYRWVTQSGQPIRSEDHILSGEMEFEEDGTPFFG